MSAVWGVHNDTLGTELVDGGFVSIGWDDLGDLRDVPSDRAALKSLLSATYPDRKPGAIAGWAGILLRFTQQMSIGDIVVAPYKKDSTINIGIISSKYEYAADATTHRHRRAVEWKVIGLSRAVFSQAALYELGAFLTVFGIRKNDDEFRAALGAPIELVEGVVERVAQDEVEAESTLDEPRASRITRHTRDFVLERLKRHLSHQEFEEFVATVLRALGYEARVTAYSNDGGVDVIAHRDPLGVEPPLIKVQCKHQITTVGSPEVQQLVGTQAPGELALFVTLGGYSKDALSIERVRQGLRLISGEDLVDLVLSKYSDLPLAWRQRIPLTPILVVDDTADL